MKVFWFSLKLVLTIAVGASALAGSVALLAPAGSSLTKVTTPLGKLDVDHNQKVVSAYGVRSIPTLLLFKSGKVVEQLVGAGSNTKAKLEEAFKKAM